ALRQAPSGRRGRAPPPGAAPRSSSPHASSHPPAGHAAIVPWRYAPWMLPATQFEPDALVAALVATDPSLGSRPGEVRGGRAPGRDTAGGEPGYYAVGSAPPAAAARETRTPSPPADDGRVELTRLDDGTRDGFLIGGGRPRAGTWLDYVAGTAWALGETGAPL